MTVRQGIEEYIHSKYNGTVEYLWKRFPDYGIVRHQDNQKWYGLFMDVPRNKMDLTGEGNVEILNIKLGDILLHDLLIRQPGYFPGYHISRGNWISVLLDGTVPLDEICGLIDVSYRVTASAQTRQAIRPPKEWLIPSNPKYFDIVHAFDHTDEIHWKQGAGIKTGDTVFLYVGSPVSAILYQCLVIQTGIPWKQTRTEIRIPFVMMIRLIRRYEPSRFSFERLCNEFDVRAVRGPRGIPESLSKALHS